MKPNFALDLSHEGINLLHRAKGGWRLVGSVPLDDPQLADRLNDMRHTAAMLESDGFTCKLVIPDSQILYTTVEVEGADDIARETSIRNALEGLTPYPVGELVFDWRAQGNKARVAVLARETLDEAEGFAVEYQFNPVSFVARPARGAFSGEPFFGKTTAAMQILGPHERVVPDASPVPQRSLLSETPPAQEAPPQPEPTPPTPDPAPQAEDSFTGVDQLAAEPATPAQPAETQKPKRASGGRRKRKTRKRDAQVTAPVLAPFPPTPDEVDDVAAPAHNVLPERPHQKHPKTRPPHPRVEIPPQPETTAPDQPTSRPARSPEPQPGPAPGAQNAPEPAAPQGPSASASVAFHTHRETVPDTTTPPTERLSRIAPRIAIPGSDTVTPAAPDRAEMPEQKPAAKPVDAFPGPAKPSVTAQPEISERGLSRSERSRRNMQKALGKPLPGQSPEPEGTPTHTRLATVANATATAAGSAAQNVAGTLGAGWRATRETVRKQAAALQFRRAARNEAAVSAPAEPAVKPETRAAAAPTTTEPRFSPARLIGRKREKTEAELARERESEALTVFGARRTQEVRESTSYLPLVLTLALLLAMAIVFVWSGVFVDKGGDLFNPDPSSVAETPDVPSPATQPDPLPGPVGEVLTPEAAAARYAATGIWQRAPEAMVEPGMARVGTASGDALQGPAETVPAQALPDVPAGQLSADTLNATQPPPPAGTTFDLDENGMVRPTRRGALSPTGALVVLGRPAATPPARPGTLPPSAQPEPALQGPVVQDPAVQGPGVQGPPVQTPAPPFALPGVPRTRPKSRPANIPERVTEAVPQTVPNARPAVDIAVIDDVVEDVVEAAFAGSTEYAVASSRSPNHRPPNFSSIVESARARASDGSTVVAAAKPSSIPTRANVAQQATTANALNLRKINLIGVFGTSNARRALVRLSNGRYVRVEVGDRLDGGKVTSISSKGLTYQKGRRTYSLDVLPLG